MLGPMEQPSRRDEAQEALRRGAEVLPAPVPAGVRLEGQVRAARTGLWVAGRRVLAGAEVAGRLALRVLEDPVLGPRYLRTAFLQGGATVTLAAAGLALGDGLTDVLADRKLGPLGQATAVAAAIWGALLVAQWAVVALSREFQDALSREASLRVGLEPEDPPRIPRVRLDRRWLRAKARRWLRAWLVLVPGLAVIGVVSLFLPHRTQVFSLLSGLWAAHWSVVWTAGKSARAWVEPVPREPWFLRGWDTLSALPGGRLLAPRWFGRLWRRIVRTVWAPVSAAERLPLELCGLALVRFCGALPLVKFFVRPLIPVAAGLLLERGQQAAQSLRPDAGATRAAHLPRA